MLESKQPIKIASKHVSNYGRKVALIHECNKPSYFLNSKPNLGHKICYPKLYWTKYRCWTQKNLVSAPFCWQEGADRWTGEQAGGHIILSSHSNLHKLMCKELEKKKIFCFCYENVLTVVACFVFLKNIIFHGVTSGYHLLFMQLEIQPAISITVQPWGRVNKLGLNWAKLSSRLDWTLL